MAKTIFEEMGGKYERQGDYLIPCLTVPAEEEQPIGIWGQRHLDYLKHQMAGKTRPFIHPFISSMILRNDFFNDRKM